MSTQKHWLVRPETIRLLWVVFGIVLVLTLVAELFVEGHPHFAIDAIFGFYAWFGFGVCVLMVLAAKLLGVFLKRQETYYHD